jgi:hypothetical protein
MSLRPDGSASIIFVDGDRACAPIKLGPEAVVSQFEISAIAFLYGPRTAYPRPGDLAVMRHHVGFVEGIEPDGSIRLISGNWGHRVARSLAPRWTIVAFVEAP